MGIQLPGWLTEPLSWIGMEWPQADEERLFDAALTWMSFGTAVLPVGMQANSAAQMVWTTNEGPASKAFEDWWTDDDGPTKRLSEDALAALVIGAALVLFAAITLIMKILWIVQLIMLAVSVAMAIAAAIPSLGASLSSIPAFIAACRMACMRVLRRVVDDVIKKSVKNLFEKAKKLLKKVPRSRSNQDATTTHPAGWSWNNIHSAGWSWNNTFHYGNTRLGDLQQRFPELRHDINSRVSVDSAHQINCQSCVFAVESSLRGHPFSAIPRPLDANGNLLPDPRFNWPYSTNYWLGGNNPMRRASGYDDISGELLRAGEGARAIVHGMRRDVNGNIIPGHVFNVVNRDGRIHWIDGQSGGYAYLEDYADFELMRTG